jgi:uncharacterized RDD family membrane protein YckC
VQSTENGSTLFANETAPPEFAGFGARLGASFFDTFIILPFIIFEIFAGEHSRAASVVVHVATSVVFVGYQIIFHARHGQTVGKMIAHIKVTDLNFRKIGLGRAVLRSSVDLIFQILVVYLVVQGIYLIPEPEFVSLGFIKQNEKINALVPMLMIVSNLQFVWALSEAFVMITNHKRRSIHDFIAGTVVVKVRP